MHAELGSGAAGLTALDQRLMATERSIEAESSRIRDDLQLGYSKEIEAYKQQIAKSEAHAVGLENALNTVRHQYEMRIAELEGNLKKVKTAKTRLEKRRALDVEGFAADISAMRKTVVAVDRRLHAARLDDEGKIDTLRCLADLVDVREVLNAKAAAL